MIASDIFELIKSTFPNSTVKIDEKTTASDVDEWDSLGHIMLIQAIEEKFNIEFDLDELLDINNVGDIIQITKNKVLKDK
jgi:acyl carrier protein